MYLALFSKYQGLNVDKKIHYPISSINLKLLVATRQDNLTFMVPSTTTRVTMNTAPAKRSQKIITRNIMRKIIKSGDSKYQMILMPMHTCKCSPHN